MYGPPGTGKTLLARACAAQTNGSLPFRTIRDFNEHFSNISEVSRICIGSNVYWWWCKIGQRCIRIRIEFVIPVISECFFEKSICRIHRLNSLQQKKSSLLLFSLMKSMPLVQSVLIQKRLVTEKSKELCSNFCHNLMVSRRVISRTKVSDQIRIVLPIPTEALLLAGHLRSINGFSDLNLFPKCPFRFSQIILLFSQSQMTISKSLLPRIELIFWIQHCFVQVDSIEKSNSLDQIKKLELVLCKFMQERWTAIPILTLMNSLDVVTISTVCHNPALMSYPLYYPVLRSTM